MNLLSRTLLAGLVTVLGLNSVGFAQCPPRPDGLDGGPCCAQANASLPNFPRFQQDIVDICWKDCDVEAVIPCFVEWSKGIQIAYPGGQKPCGVRESSLRIMDAAGVNKWFGRMYLTYSRTWQETGPTGDLQVWRFLVNGDMHPTAAAGGSPCPVPPCVTQNGNRARFTGYIDYAQNCNAQWQMAWMLTHACDQIDHNPGFPRGGSYHPDRSYSFVGPGVSFAPGPLQPTEGGGGGFEALRRLRLPTAGANNLTQCEYEEQAQHQLSPQQNFCLCGPATATPQWTASDLFVSGACGSFLHTPGMLRPSFFSMGIGMWTDPARFPGLEALRWNAAGYTYNDPCVGINRDEVWYGVTTIRGYPAVQVLSTGVGTPLPLIFIDQSNSLRNGATTMNLPYRSDHVLNLNH
jgi:hypothetical protein